MFLTYLALLIHQCIVTAFAVKLLAGMGARPRYLPGLPSQPAYPAAYPAYLCISTHHPHIPTYVGALACLGSRGAGVMESHCNLLTARLGTRDSADCPIRISSNPPPL